MLPCVGAADALWDKVFLTGTCVLGGQESKPEIWGKKSETQPAFFCEFVLFAI